MYKFNKNNYNSINSILKNLKKIYIKFSRIINIITNFE